MAGPYHARARNARGVSHGYIAPFCGHLGSMTTLAIVFAALAAVAGRAVSFRFGAWQISAATTTGLPAHLTFNQARDAIKAALTQGAGKIQTGVVVVTIAPWGTPL